MAVTLSKSFCALARSGNFGKTASEKREIDKDLTEEALQIEKESTDEKKDARTIRLAKLVSIAPNFKYIHTVTKSFARHKGLDDAFKAFNKEMDIFCECARGAYPDAPVVSEAIEYETPKGREDTIKAVKDLEKGFRDCSDPIVKDNPVLENIQTNVLAGFLRLYYWLSFKED